MIPVLCRWLLSVTTLLLLSGCGGRQQLAPRELALRFTIGAKTPVTHYDLMGERPISFTVDEETLSCRGNAGFSQFVPEAPVEIRDERGTLIGKAELGPGRVTLTSPDQEGRNRYQACTFEQRIPLNGPARIYSIRISGERFVRREHISTLLRTNGEIRYFTD
ncbi:hypothetical protein BBFGKLBO_00062 [Synechococcus sp. CBW1107]|nr:hypothetical protein BBFGKLBO_00062 [Synechococcus sp. CBW1107]